jgi:hypothetical protein
MSDLTVTTAEEIESLPAKSVLLDSMGDVWQRRGTLWCSYETAPSTSKRLAKYAPLTLLAPVPETTKEWAVQTKETFDGPWERIDDGRGWMHRGQVPYTEEEARAVAAKRINGIDPKLWRRVVCRTVTAYKRAPLPKEN